MRELLDDELLNGPQPCYIRFRPERIARPVEIDSLTQFLSVIEYECQIWGGASTALIPVPGDGSIPSEYRKSLAGSSIDKIFGLPYNAMYHLDDPSLTIRSGAGHPSAWMRHLAVAMNKYRDQKSLRPLKVTTLASEDPWRGIYAACLGLLPDLPDQAILGESNYRDDLRFDDFFAVAHEHAEGSLDDLLDRIADPANTNPRRSSMVHLHHGNLGSTSIRTADSPIPDRNHQRNDAGPNIIVVCTPGAIEDVALLWNLRTAWGDVGLMPIGLLRESVNPQALERIAHHEFTSHQGISSTLMYLTSATLSPTELTNLVPAERADRYLVAPTHALLNFGAPPAWNREEIVVWHGGAADIVPLVPGSHHESLLRERGIVDYTGMRIDIQVADQPFPDGPDITVNLLNGYIRGGYISNSAGRRRTEPIHVTWPSRLLSARAVAARRGLTMRESEPGRAARVALAGLHDFYDLGLLRHRPLLQHLEKMAARSGFGWYKQRLRSNNEQPHPIDAVGPTTDELPESTYGEFKRIFRNNDRATRNWLKRAEDSGLVVKGFQLQCDRCRAKQWIPVAAFSPPIVCRGCGETMATPFGDQPQAEFRYRLSERLRRVYEHDAMGHLLTMYFFHLIFGGPHRNSLVGSHPGMEFSEESASQTLGEADVLLVSRTADLIPIEVKRSFSGMNSDEVAKLDRLAHAMQAPWSAVVACEYGDAASDDFKALERRTGQDAHRLILGYDALLDPFPRWTLGDDPFAWSLLTPEELEEREAKFIQRLAKSCKRDSVEWQELYMLERPKLPEAGER